MIETETITGNDIRIVWQDAIEYILKHGTIMEFGGENERKKAYDSSINFYLTKDAVKQALDGQVHPDDPFATPKKLKEYLKEYRRGFDASVFDYTYLDRLTNGFSYRREDQLYFGENRLSYRFKPIDQLEILKNGLREQIDDELPSNRNIAILYNPGIDNYSGLSRPCFNEILIRWEGEIDGQNYASVHTLFRSHDIGVGWNSNMYGIGNMIYSEVMLPNDCEILYWNEKNFSAHIYLGDEQKLRAIRKIRMLNP